MKTLLFIVITLLLFRGCIHAQSPEKKIKQSYFKLTTSNGLISAVYDAKKNSIEYVYPHLFANYDSGQYVRPFIGNIKINSSDVPVKSGYLKNTHLISAEYKNYTAFYFASFINNEKIFYVVLRGSKPFINDLSVNSESGDGKILSGIKLLTNSHEDLTVLLGGKTIQREFSRPYNKTLDEKYFLFSFTDSLHKDTSLISKAIKRLSISKSSLVDDELSYMQNLFLNCKIPGNITAQERNVVEQSISFLKMSQVSDNEIFPYSRGQILASLPPGLWHAAWVRDGSYAIKAMTHLGMDDESRKGLEFMLKAPSGRYKHFIYKDGKDYGVGSEYQISVCRYFGNGKEESTYGEGPNIEFDNFGLFLSAFTDYVSFTKDTNFYKKWNQMVTQKVADVIISCIDTNSLIREDSGPWEHYLQMPRQYTFTSGVCAEGLRRFSELQKEFNLPYEKYLSASERLKNGILEHMLCDGKYIKGNVNDKLKTDHEYYDSGVYELFANGLITDSVLFASHMKEYDQVLRIPGDRPGYIRLRSTDPYENQEWVFINLRIALAHILFGEKEKALKLLNHITYQASINYNTIPEMYSNKIQLQKVTDEFKSNDVWCNCLRKEGDQFIGAIPMIGYGSGTYILTLLSYYNN